MKQIITLLLLITSISFSQDFWEPTNGPYGWGQILDLEVSPKGDIIIAVEDMGILGLFRSSDNGVTFEQIATELLTHSDFPLSIQDIEINSNGDILLGTYENGIFRSSDDGITWAEINNGFANSENKIPLLRIIEIDKNGIIYLGTLYSGIFKSSDLGNTWEEISEGLPEKSPIYSIAISPEGFIFAGFWFNGIYVSEYNGDIWWEFTDRDCGRALAIDSSGIIYGAGGDGIYRTDDLGNTWEDITIDPIINHRSMRYGVPKMEINNSGELYYCMSFGTYFSSDSGDTWLKILDGKASCLAFNSSNSVFIGYEGKVFYKNTFDEDWETKYTTTSEVTITCLSINPLNEIFAGTNQLWKSKDKGETWNVVLEEPVLSLTFNDEYLFAGGYDGIYRSDHDGENFNHSHSGLGDIESLASNLNGDIFAVSHQNGIFRSRNNGITWSEINNGLPVDSLFGRASINTIAVTREGKIFAGLGENYGIYRSINNGDSWEAVNNGFTNGNDNLSIYALFVSNNGDVYAGGYESIYKTSDYGDTWIEYDKGLPSDYRVTSITEDSQGYLLVGTFKNGIYQSKDSGNTWNPMSNGLPMDDSLYNYITSFAISSDGYVFVGTYRNSVFKSVNANPTEVTKSAIPKDYLLSQNYPNPFNPSTTIKYQIPAVVDANFASTTNVSLIVYDILGREVATLVNEKQKPGYYEVDFNANGLASGIYFYKLQAGEFIQTKKMLMIK